MLHSPLLSRAQRRNSRISIRSLSGRLRRVSFKSFIVPILFVVLWYWSSTQNVFSSLIPTPHEVWSAFSEWMFGSETGAIQSYFAGLWLESLQGSLWRAGAGFVIGAFAAVTIGVLVGWSTTFSQLVDPSIQLVRAVPRTALLPFAIIFLGLGNTPAIALVAVGAFLQIYIQVVTGVRLVPRDLKRAAYMLGAKNYQVLLRVVIPHALPSIFAGFRLGVVYAWTMLILAEMFATGSGFGYILWRSYEYLRVDLLVAALLSIAVAGWLSDRLILFFMRRTTGWATAIAETEF